jgi:23S rRNA (guanosine2251-2'-O)-methyltransferase
LTNGLSPRGDKPFVKRPYDPDRKPPYRARSEDGAPRGDKPFVKRPYDPDRKPAYRARSEEGGDRPKFDRAPRGDKPFAKRPYDPDRKPAYRPRPEAQFESGADGRSESASERPAFEKRPYNRDGKPPFQKKPFVKRGWTEEKPTPRRDRDFPESRHIANPENDLIHGHHAVSAALANSKRKHVHLWATENGLSKMVDDNVTLPDEVETVHPRLLDHMLAGQDAVHQGIVLECEPLEQPQLNQIEKGGLIVLLDQVTDPHNVGAILRTSAAFGVAAVISPARHAAAATGVMFKAASGAYEHVPMVKVTNLATAMEELKGYGYTIVGLDSEAETSIDDVEKKRPMALVLGAEGKGLRELTRETCDVVAKLDMAGTIKSLNVSNAAAVSLYALTRS